MATNTSVKVGYGTAGDFQTVGDALAHDLAGLNTGETGNATGVMQAHYEDLLGVAALALGTTVEKITATCNKAGTRVYLSAPRGSGTGTRKQADAGKQAQAPVNPVAAFLAGVETKAQAVADALGMPLDEARALVTSRMGDGYAAVLDADGRLAVAQQALEQAQANVAAAQQALADALAAAQQAR